MNEYTQKKDLKQKICSDKPMFTSENPTSSIFVSRDVSSRRGPTILLDVESF